VVVSCIADSREASSSEWNCRRPATLKQAYEGGVLVESVDVAEADTSSDCGVPEGWAFRHFVMTDDGLEYLLVNGSRGTLIRFEGDGNDWPTHPKIMPAHFRGTWTGEAEVPRVTSGWQVSLTVSEKRVNLTRSKLLGTRGTEEIWATCRYEGGAASTGSPEPSTERKRELTADLRRESGPAGQCSKDDTLRLTLDGADRAEVRTGRATGSLSR
jgi:hypothetical protein